jgi:hypothetical protein
VFLLPASVPYLFVHILFLSAHLSFFPPPADLPSILLSVYPFCLSPSSGLPICLSVYLSPTVCIFECPHNHWSPACPTACLSLYRSFLSAFLFFSVWVSHCCCNQLPHHSGFK